MSYDDKDKQLKEDVKELNRIVRANQIGEAVAFLVILGAIGIWIWNAL